MRTSGAKGDCERGNAGTWTLGDEFEEGIVSLDDCARRCARP